MRNHWKILLIGSLAVTAACGKKAAKELPPPPPQARTETAAPTPTPQPMVRDTVVPGSLADFRRSVSADKVHFGYDSYEIEGENRDILDSQAQWLAKYPNVQVTIEGHADERGTREYNLALGERRANQVKTYLAGKGIAAGRINTISYGKERPEVEGSNEQSWAANRRAVTVPGNGLAS